MTSIREILFGWLADMIAERVKSEIRVVMAVPGGELLNVDFNRMALWTNFIHPNGETGVVCDPSRIRSVLRCDKCRGAALGR